MEEKLVSRLRLTTAKESVKLLQSHVKTSLQSFKTDSANLSFFKQILCACMSYGISYLSPKAKNKKEVCKTVCDRKTPEKEGTAALECSTFVIASCCIWLQCMKFFVFCHILFCKPLSCSSPWDSNKIFHSLCKHKRFVWKKIDLHCHSRKTANLFSHVIASVSQILLQLAPKMLAPKELYEIFSGPVESHWGFGAFRKYQMDALCKCIP